MAIPSSSIVDLATPIHKRANPGIEQATRDRLEWTWGLGHGNLDEHLREFDNSRVATAEGTFKKAFVDPTFNRIFEYLIVPVDPIGTAPARLLTVGVPPHLALCTTFGKILKAWGNLSHIDWDGECLALVDRAGVAPLNGRPPLEMWQLNEMENVYRKWSWSEYVPPSFLTEEFDKTMVEPEEVSHRDTRLRRRLADGNAELEPTSRYELKRRRLPSPELKTGYCFEDDLDELDARASLHEDYVMNRKLEKKIQRWLAEVGTSRSEADETLLNDGQIKYDSPRERSRNIKALDLKRPDFMTRFHDRMAV
ncbi:hypothetical protein B0H12DRAFT_1079823 [Mycena haematopus]|nr:hypothetical protein B0H12DRAFT_1079823 [Mycena haematopus]